MQFTIISLQTLGCNDHVVYLHPFWLGYNGFMVSNGYYAFSFGLLELFNAGAYFDLQWMPKIWRY